MTAGIHPTAIVDGQTVAEAEFLAMLADRDDAA